MIPAGGCVWRSAGVYYLHRRYRNATGRNHKLFVFCANAFRTVGNNCSFIIRPCACVPVALLKGIISY